MQQSIIVLGLMASILATFVNYGGAVELLVLQRSLVDIERLAIAKMPWLSKSEKQHFEYFTTHWAGRSDKDLLSLWKDITEKFPDQSSIMEKLVSWACRFGMEKMSKEVYMINRPNFDSYRNKSKEILQAFDKVLIERAKRLEGLLGNPTAKVAPKKRLSADLEKHLRYYADYWNDLEERLLKTFPSEGAFAARALQPEYIPDNFTVSVFNAEKQSNFADYPEADQEILRAFSAALEKVIKRWRTWKASQGKTPPSEPSKAPEPSPVGPTASGNQAFWSSQHKFNALNEAIKLLESTHKTLSKELMAKYQRIMTADSFIMEQMLILINAGVKLGSIDDSSTETFGRGVFTIGDERYAKLIPAEQENVKRFTQTVDEIWSRVLQEKIKAETERLLTVAQDESYIKRQNEEYSNETNIVKRSIIRGSEDKLPMCYYDGTTCTDPKDKIANNDLVQKYREAIEKLESSVVKWKVVLSEEEDNPI